MSSQQPFYTVSSYTGNLREGQHIEVRRQLLYQGENADFKPFLQFPVNELNASSRAVTLTWKEFRCFFIIRKAPFFSKAFQFSPPGYKRAAVPEAGWRANLSVEK